MMKFLIFFTFINLAHADWSGDILCTRNGLRSLYQADGIGRIDVVETTNSITATLTMNIRLFGNYGQTKGSEITDTKFITYEIGDGNDLWLATFKPVTKNDLIKKVSLDLSNLNKRQSLVLTKKHNEYEMNCDVRIH